jgi:hypothetical protein
MAESEIGSTTRQQRQQKIRGQLRAHPKGGRAVRGMSETASLLDVERGREESREMNAAPSPSTGKLARSRARDPVGEDVAPAHAAAHCPCHKEDARACSGSPINGRTGWNEMGQSKGVKTSSERKEPG